MAVVAPFPAVRYDPSKVGGLDRVLTQPYDKITPRMQREYFERSPYNLARIIRGEVKESDSASDNVYTRAAAYFRNWLEQGILVERSTPALYAYFQQFNIPGDTGHPPLLRKGFIGLGKLEEYSSGVVFRHEQTLSAPKADRLDLLRATRAHFGQIFMLYTDPGRSIDGLLDHVAIRAPLARLEDDYGTVHTLWDIENPQEIQIIQDQMQDRKLIIADGHHRYETALNFQRECRSGKPHSGAEACSYVMMTFINMDSDGIVILPTHRLISGIPEFSRAGFLSRAARYFSGREYPYSGPGQRNIVMRKMRQDMATAADSGVTAIGASFQGSDAFYMLHLRNEVKLEELLKDLAPSERSLDVTILHRIAFGLCLGIDEDAVRKEKVITYVREFEEGAQSVAEGKAQACFFLNPVRMEQVREIAFEGKFLPQKSTDFYPKLLSGLTIYKVEN